MLEGIVTECHFVKLTKLKHIAASGNLLTLKVDRNWVPPFKLEVLRLGSWKLGGEDSNTIPSWIRSHESITRLDLSNTGLSGTVPDPAWFWNIEHLDLSHNQLHGTIPSITPHGKLPHHYHLSSNLFSGLLPRITASLGTLDLSNNSFSGNTYHFFCDTSHTTYHMSALLLDGNELNGVLPDCLTKWPDLEVLHLGNNSITGSIPNSIGFLPRLAFLFLHDNKISGCMPMSMLNCTSLWMIDLSNNFLEGNILPGIGRSLVLLHTLILRSNRFHGELSSDICYLDNLGIMDLSNNNLFGRIPHCINNLTSMIDYGWSRPALYMEDFVFRESAYLSTKGRELSYDGNTPIEAKIIDLSNNNFSGGIPKELISLVELKFLNLSKNHLTGPIPSNIGDMKQLESLDLSRNSLSGQIPSSIKALSFLSYVNMSRNNLSGRIPESTQLGSQDPLSFEENNLCGPPLTSICSNGRDPPQSSSVKEENVDEKPEVEWVYVVMSLGYVMGLSSVCVMLVLKKAWRDAYFGFLEGMWDKIYVHISIKWARVVTRLGTSSFVA